jgi:steroid delta-isomerase-like uncharacterized protein
MRDVWNDRREATIDELLTPDAVGHMEGVQTHGPQGFREARAGLLAAFPDMRLTVIAAVAEGDSVVIRWNVEATHLGDAFGLTASKQKVNFRGMTWLRFENGRIVEGWDSWNQGGLLEQLRAQ